MNFKKENKYFLKIPKDFLDKFGLEKINLKDSIVNYIYSYYLNDKQKIFKSLLSNGEKIIFHKINLKDNNRSSKKSKRVLIFILINNPDGINTIFPVFCFSTQEEKKYTSEYMKTRDFSSKIMQQFLKYQNSLDVNGKQVSKTLGTKI